MEDINRQLFLNRQIRAIDRDAALDGRREGDKQEWWIRLLAGGGITLALVLALWGPLFIFSGAFPNSETDRVVLSSASLSLYQSKSYFGTERDDSYRDVISTQLWSSPDMLQSTDPGSINNTGSKKTCHTDGEASKSVSSRYYQQCLHFYDRSVTNWNPTNPQIDLVKYGLEECANGAADITTYLAMSYKLQKEINQVSVYVDLDQPGQAPQKGEMERDQCRTLRSILDEWQGNTCSEALNWTSTQVIIQNANAADITLPRDKTTGTVDTYLGCQSLAGDCALELTLRQQWQQSDWCATWWAVKQQTASRSSNPFVTVYTDSSLKGFVAVIEGSGGLVFLYGSVVLLIGRLIRQLFGNQQELIVFEDMQDLQKPSDMIMSIYIARNQGRLADEESNYRALIQLYRNPSALFQQTCWEKHKPEDTWFTRDDLERYRKEQKSKQD